LHETALANPMLAIFRVNVGCRKKPLQPESSKACLQRHGLQRGNGERGRRAQCD